MFVRLRESKVVSTFLGKGIPNKRFRRVGYVSLVLGLLVFILVHLIYQPLVWRAHYSDVASGIITVDVLEEEQAAHRDVRSALYLTRAAFLMLVISAFIAVWSHAYRKLSRDIIFVYFGIVLWTGLLFVFHPTEQPWFETNVLIYARLAPGVLVLAPILLYGFSRSAWKNVRNFVLYLSWIATFAGIIGIFQLGDSTRLSAYQWVHIPGLVLEMTVLLPLSQRYENVIARWLRFIPIIVLALIDLFLQARSGFVILLVLLVAYVWLKRDDELSVGRGMRRIKYLLLLLLVSYASYATISGLSEEGVLKGAFEGFVDRIDTDSRSFQWTGLAEALKENPDVWLWGRGHLDFDGFGHAGADGIDSGYMNILWVGGLPLLFSYGYLMALTTFRAALKRSRPSDVAVIALALGFVVRMVSSTDAGFEIQFLLFLLLQGRVFYLLNGRRKVRLRRRRARLLGAASV